MGPLRVLQECFSVAWVFQLVLKEFKIVSTADGLVVKNPPVVLMSSMTNDLSNLADES